MVYANSLEIRTDDNRLICMARLIEGDILLTLKSAGKEVHVPYTDIPRLVPWQRNGQRVTNKSDRRR